MNLTKAACIPLVAALVNLGVIECPAEPLYFVETWTTGKSVIGERISVEDQSPVSQQAVGVWKEDGLSVLSTAAATAGLVGAEAGEPTGLTVGGSSHAQLGGHRNLGGTAITTSRATIDDLIFSDTQGRSEVRVIPQVHLKGHLLAHPEVDNNAYSYFKASFRMVLPSDHGTSGDRVYSVSRQLTMNHYFAGEKGLIESGGSGFPTWRDAIVEPGFLDNPDVEVRLDGVLPAINDSQPAGTIVPIGKAVTIRFELLTRATVSTDSAEGGGNAFANFGNGFGLPTSGPVFDLPPGVTVNSAQAGIVDNRFVAVPEPSSLALLVVGMTGLVGWNWRQRKQNRNDAEVAEVML